MSTQFQRKIEMIHTLQRGKDGTAYCYHLDCHHRVAIVSYAPFNSRLMPPYAPTETFHCQECEYESRFGQSGLRDGATDSKEGAAPRSDDEVSTFIGRLRHQDSPRPSDDVATSGGAGEPSGAPGQDSDAGVADVQYQRDLREMAVVSLKLAGVLNEVHSHIAVMAISQILATMLLNMEGGSGEKTLTSTDDRLIMLVKAIKEDMHNLREFRRRVLGDEANKTTFSGESVN